MANQFINMTNDLIRRRFDAFDRITGFGTKHGGGFAAGSRGATLFAAMKTTTDAMRDAGADRLSGTGAYHGGTTGKRFWYGELQDDLEAIRDTAVSIAQAEDTPEFDDRFRLPRSQSYDAMLTAARAFLQDATPHEALFLEFEMPADFLDDLRADIAAFEKSNDEQDAGLAGQVGGTKGLEELGAEGMKVRKQLQAIVKNKLKGSASTLAEWQSAQHIERTPRRGTPEPETQA